MPIPTHSLLPPPQAKPNAKPAPKPAPKAAASKKAAADAKGGDAKPRAPKKEYPLPGQTRDTPDEARGEEARVVLGVVGGGRGREVRPRTAGLEPTGLATLTR